MGLLHSVSYFLGLFFLYTVFDVVSSNIDMVLFVNFFGQFALETLMYIIKTSENILVALTEFVYFVYNLP